MPITLYDAFVPSCVQILNGVRTQIDKAESFAGEQGIPASELINAKLADDMWALPGQVRSVWVHSKLALDLVPSGEFSPDFTGLPQDWDAMRAMVDDAISSLEATSADDLEAIADKHVHFVMGGERLMEFTVANFLLSFSQPHFYFHATTFYDILRMKGLPLAKRDYMFVPRMIGS